jgi:predicted enzyme related to lactoylglutathione lyase
MKSLLKNILDAGGKKMTDVMPEGKRAKMQHFEDTEGNYFGTYTMNK